MNADPIIVERTFEAPASKIWQALTDKDEMKKWYFDLEAFDPKPGFKFQFYGGEPGGKQYLHLCEIQEAIHERKLSYTWVYDGYAGSSLVTFELQPEGSKTRVRLTHDGVHTFPAEPDFARKNFEAGWNGIINESLKHYLES